MIQTKTPSKVDDPSGELDALIEEARRRARKRRLIIAGALAAGVLAAGGAFFLFGGGDGGGGSSDGSGAGGPSPGAASSSTSSASGVSDYQCPTSRQELRELVSGPEIPGCKVTLSADLPTGWEQSAKSVLMLPERTLGFVAYSPVHFASFGLPEPDLHPLGASAKPVPTDGIALTVQLATTRPGQTATSGSLEASDFRTAPRRGQPFAFTDLSLDGIEFRVDAMAGSEPVDPALLEEANAVLASLDTTQKLCPCVGENVTLTGVTVNEIDRSAAGGVAD